MLRRPVGVCVVTMLLTGSALVVPFASATAAAGSQVTAASFTTQAPASHSQLIVIANVMTKRLRSLGDKTSSVSVEQQRIVVRLGAGTNSHFVLSVLGTTGRLYFRPVLCDAPSYVGPPAAATLSLPTCIAPYRYRSSDFTGATSSFTFPPIDEAYAKYRSVTAVQDNPRKTIILNSNGMVPSPRVVLGPAEVPYRGEKTLTTGAMVKDAYASFNTALDQWAVVFDLTTTGTALFNVVARLDYGTLLADDFDGVVISAPIIEAMSFPGSGEVSGDYTKQTARGFAAELNSGPLPVPVVLKAQ